MYQLKSQYGDLQTKKEDPYSFLILHISRMT